MSHDTIAAIEHLAQFAAAIPGEIHPSGRMVKAALELGCHAEDIGLDADAVADVARIASLGDILGAAERLRELDGQHAG